MKQKFNLITAIAMILLLMTLVILGACAPKATPTASEKTTLPILSLIGLTGAYSAVWIPGQEGEKAVINWANETEYIPGAELELRAFDVGDDAARGVTAYKKGMGDSPRPVIMVAHSSTLAFATSELIARDEIPHINGCTHPALQEKGWTISYQARYDGQLCAQADYFLENIWKESRPAKIGYMAWNNMAGKAAMSGQVPLYIESKGADYMGEVWIPPNASDTMAQALKLKEWDVDCIICGVIYPSDEQVLIKDLDKIGMTGKFLVGHPSTCDICSMVRFTGPELTSGFFQLHPYLTRDEWPSWLESSFVSSELPDETWMSYACGVGMASMWLETLRIATNDVGVENITSKDCYNAVRKIKDYDFLWGNAMDLTEDLIGMHNYRVFELESDGAMTYTGKIQYIPNLWPGGKDRVE